MKHFASRAGAKLAHALEVFKVDVTGKICIDLGCSTGGFTDVLLQNGAEKVMSVDTGYGVLEWKLRQDPRVEVYERQNALHFEPKEKADLITIDTSWTKQEKILPEATRMLKDDGMIITLVKPHYEAEENGISDIEAEVILKQVIDKINTDLGLEVLRKTLSPIKGKSGGNPEFLLLLKKR